jgi:hypothetical protein
MRRATFYLFVISISLGIALSSAFAHGSLLRRHSVRLADAHTDACVYNYNQCMTGCDGMSSCESQCQANYNGCMSQGQ